MKIIKMHFKSPLHIGNKEGIMETTQKTIPSDLLFSVFCNAYRKLYGKNELEEIIDRYKEKPLFLFTSAFPFYDDELYFPIPIGLNLINYGFLPKAAKKVKYIPKNLFFKSLKGTLTAKDFSDYEEDPVQNLLVRRGSPEKRFFVEREVPRVSLDRITSASNIYYFAELSFKEGCGLFFGVSGMDKAFWPKFLAAMRLAADEGIGGDRSIGKGHFQIELSERINFPSIDSPKSQVLLSRYFPKTEEIPDLDGEFVLQKRAGYMYSVNETARRKKTLHMMAEGSIFYQSRVLTGKMVDVTPEGFTRHRVYVNGYALTVPSLIGKEELQCG